MNNVQSLNDYMMQHNDYNCMHESQININEFTYYDLSKYPKTFTPNINTKNMIHLFPIKNNEYYHGKSYINIIGTTIEEYVIISKNVYDDIQKIQFQYSNNNNDIMDIMEIDRNCIGLYVDNKGIIIPNFD